MVPLQAGWRARALGDGDRVHVVSIGQHSTVTPFCLGFSRLNREALLSMPAPWDARRWSSPLPWGFPLLLLLPSPRNRVQCMVPALHVFVFWSGSRPGVSSRCVSPPRTQVGSCRDSGARPPPRFIVGARRLPGPFWPCASCRPWACMVACIGVVSLSLHSCCTLSRTCAIFQSACSIVRSLTWRSPSA